MEFDVAYQIYQNEIKPVLNFVKPRVYLTELNEGNLFVAGKYDRIWIEYDKDVGLFLVYLGNYNPISFTEVEIVRRNYGFVITGRDRYNGTVCIHIDFS